MYYRYMFPTLPITNDTYVFSLSCSLLYMLNADLVTQYSTHPYSPLFVRKDSIRLPSHRIHRLSKVFSVQFLHLSLCDVLQTQLLSNPSARPETAGQVLAKALAAGTLWATCCC